MEVLYKSKTGVRCRGDSVGPDSVIRKNRPNDVIVEVT